MYFSPVNPVHIILYTGKLVNYEKILCGVRGLSKIAKAINNYNSNCEHKKSKIRKIHMKLDMTEYEEKALKISDIWKVVYSNKLVLKRMNIRPKPFQIVGSANSTKDYRNKILMYLKNIGRVLKAFFKGKIHKKFPSNNERDLVKRYEILVDGVLKKMDGYVRKGRYDEILKRQAKITLDRINRRLVEIQSHPKNIIFMFMQEYFLKNGRFGFYSQNLKGIMSGFFKKLGESLKQQQKENRTRNLLDEDLEQQLKELHGLCDGFVLEYKDVFNYKTTILKNSSSCYSRTRGTQRFLLGVLGFMTIEMKDQIINFATKYMNEPSMYNTLKKNNLLVAKDLLNMERFNMFFAYIGQQVTAGNNNMSYSCNLFTSKRRRRASTYRLI